MCGIAGLAGEYREGLAAAMNAAQAHRGPDGHGIFEAPKEAVVLAHVRLSILDLSKAAAQPMFSPDGRFVLVYNGEVYNYSLLRQDLAAYGEQFVSTGDTEVLLRGLMREGLRFLPKLNGMFAFALWDRRERELLLVRDPLGVKPLYLTEPAPGALLFASEIKALFAYSGLPRRPDYEGLVHHLSFCHASGQRTAVKGIHSLPPGHLLRWRAGSRQIEIRPYWTPPFNRSPPESRDQALERLRHLLKESVLRQMISDVPVGTFFSGGIDSTIITAIAASERRNSEFHCYTITYPSSENVLDGATEDTPYARRIAGALGLSHIEWELKPDVTDLWPKLIHFLDEPIADPAAIACYLVSKLARQNGTPVLLSGQGADELFAGYPRYRAMALTGMVDHVPMIARRGLASLGMLLPGVREGRFGATLRRFRRMLTPLANNRDERFMAYCASSPEAEVLGILNAEFRKELQGRGCFSACLDHMDTVGLSGVDRWLERDLSIYLPNHNLLYTDKMAMSVGLEARVPLLDLSLVEEVVRYPVEWKISRGITKAILRDAARGFVPAEVINRPKAGFGAPYRKWLRYDLTEMWEDLTTEAVVKRRGWFDYAALKRIRDLSQSGKQDLYMLQWAVLTIELWARQFIDRNPAEGVSLAPSGAKS